jgi:hypothetical protein
LIKFDGNWKNCIVEFWRKWVSAGSPSLLGVLCRSWHHISID